MFVRRSQSKPLRSGLIQQAQKKSPERCFVERLLPLALGVLYLLQKGLVTKNITKNVFEANFLPTHQSHFPDRDVNFQQDIAPRHISKKMTKNVF